ncbi:hypothetical protein ABT352_06955 [Streptosporangium sp. NPDC000563]|uniref:hypothetical protein n=1 Tax=unclassified Streptosporangium TaxID=2632669 RepID=UPI003327A4E4
MPVLGLAGGAALMALLLFGQGALGVRPPYGEGGTLTEVAPRYLPAAGRLLLGWVLGAAMIGWNGFNVGLGGASLAAVFGIPGPMGALLLAAAVLAVSYASPAAGNRIAVLTTLAALALVTVCVALLRPATPPVTLSMGGPGGLGGLGVAADIAVIGGYVSVFALRAPDFSRGLSTRRDLVRCVLLLVAPAVVVIAAGAGVWLHTGSTDVVSALADADGLSSYANLFVTAGVFAPALTTTYSGALALRAVRPTMSNSAAMLMVTVPGALLATVRFDLLLLPWLSVLGAILPPLIIPMATEAWRRRRGRSPRPVATWTWLPAGLVATALTVAGSPVAGVAGLALASLATVSHLWRGRR